MCYEIVFWIFLLSKPIRLRGLKFSIMVVHRERKGVEAYTASWIEIFVVADDVAVAESKPIRLRGLKSNVSEFLKPCNSRSLYGFVDWNYHPLGNSVRQISRSLYGFVDWNPLYSRKLVLIIVEAYTASWIEIVKDKVAVIYLDVEAYTASWIEILLRLNR